MEHMPAHFHMEPLLDRRSKFRYPIQFDLEYRTTRRSAPVIVGIGHTINISSRGLLFRTSEKLPQGSAIEAVLHWPVALDDHIQLKLTIKGDVIRSERDEVAVQIASYEFRTSGAARKSSQAEARAALAAAGG